MIQSFAGYSFCKAHSASYCLVSFKSCYLKAHYPAEFMASVISNQGGYYSIEAYLDEVRRMGLKVYPPCVVNSDYHYQAQGEGIRIGLMQIKGIHQRVLKNIFEARNKSPFESLEDFLLRANISFNDAKKLCRARCLNELCSNGSLVFIMWKIYFFFTGVNSSKAIVFKQQYRPHEKKQIVRWAEDTLGGYVTIPQWALFKHLRPSLDLQ